MKFTVAFFTILAAFAAINANPISVSNNNVGDIVTVGVNANLQATSDINVNIITAILALLNQQALIVSPQAAGDVQPESILPSLITPETLTEAKNIKITPEMIEGFKQLLQK
jgi:hypothetical protein